MFLKKCFFLIDSGLRPNVVSSMSAKTGFASTKRTEFAVEIKENEGTMISFLVPKSYARKVACSAEVPEFRVIQ